MIKVLRSVERGDEIVGCGEESIGLCKKGVESGGWGGGGEWEEIEVYALVEKGGEAQDLVDLVEGSRGCNRGGQSTIHSLRGPARPCPCFGCDPDRSRPSRHPRRLGSRRGTLPAR